MNSSRSTSLQAAVSLALPLALGACSRDPTPAPADAARDVAADISADTVTQDVGTDATADVAVDATADVAADVVRDGGAGPRALTSFSAAMGQLPEGLALRGGAAYVGFAPTGQVMRIDATGAMTMFGVVPLPTAASPQGYLLGLAFDSAGLLYAAVPSFAATVRPGIYRFPMAGGTATLFASNAMMNFPNGIDFDAAGNIFVADSGGRIFKVTPDGMTTAVWSDDALLVGGMGPCGAMGNPFPIGANGIVIDRAGMGIFVTNTDKGSFLRIPITATGPAGPAVSLVTSDCARLRGADGLVRDSDGTFIATANAINALTRITADGRTLTTVAMGGVLDSPASLAIDTVMGVRTLFITNAAFVSAQADGGMPHPNLATLALP